MAREIPGFPIDKHPEAHLQRLMKRPNVTSNNASEMQKPTKRRRVAAVAGTLMRRPARLLGFAIEAGIYSGGEYLFCSIPTKVQAAGVMGAILETVILISGELSADVIKEYKKEKIRGKAKVGVPEQLPKQPGSFCEAWRAGEVQRTRHNFVFVRGPVPPRIERYRREERHTEIKKGPEAEREAQVSSM